MERALAVSGEQAVMGVIASKVTVPKALCDLGPAPLPSLISRHALTAPFLLRPYTLRYKRALSLLRGSKPSHMLFPMLTKLFPPLPA